MEKRISIIVPVYNVENYLEECIRSIAEQTYQNIEIILIDDGSSDRSPAICDAWAAKDSRVRVCHQPNRGVSAARNRALELATGDYLYFVDSDDFIAPHLCQRTIEVLEAEEADMVVFGISRVTETGAVFEQNPGKTVRLDRKEALTALFSEEMKHYPCNKLFKRSLWDGVKFPTGRVFEDIGTIYKAVLNADSVCWISDMLYFYRRRENSTIAQMKTESLRDLFFIRKNAYDDMMEIYPEVAAHGFENVAKSALAFIDRSLWSPSDEEILTQAKEFLQKNRQRVYRLKHQDLTLYLKMPHLYRTLRLLKHRAGCAIRAIKK